MSERIWSDEQNAIFTHFEDRNAGHLTIIARAGTGKTTTIIEGVNRAPETSILLAAFNKKIATELTERIANPHAEAKTLHALGFALVRRFWNGVRVATNTKDRVNDLTDRATLAEYQRQVAEYRASGFGQGPRQCPDEVKALVGNLHSKAREINPLATNPDELIDLALTFECVPGDSWAAEGFDLAYVCRAAVKAMELAAASKPATGIDFSDMIFLPVRNGWVLPMYDLVVVDEAQDMTLAQLIIAEGVLRKGGRLVVVGDDRQAIYAFRGADSESLGRLTTKLGSTVLGLKTTYRCGKAIVALAQEFVPDFRANETNPEGEVLNLGFDKLVASAEYGDFVLSRVNAPLVSIAMSLLRNGKRARIAGRDIGASLKALIRKLSSGKASSSLPVLTDRVMAWRDKEINRLLKLNREERVEGVHDQAETLLELIEASTSVSDLENRIDVLFTDDGLGAAGVVTCSSVHRSKGLEANRVFVLAKTLRARNQEELNIQYVAITRAKMTLVMVHDAAPVA